LAADVLDVPTVLIARTDANGSYLITSDIDPADKPFVSPEPRTSEGFFILKGGIEAAVARGLAYAPDADVIWCETSRPDLEEARYFAQKIHEKYPHKFLAYNCSPSFNWSANLDPATIAHCQEELGKSGYKFQFVTLIGFHVLNMGRYELALKYKSEARAAYSRLQSKEFDYEEKGYTGTKYLRFAGAGYFGQVAQAIMGEGLSNAAPKGSTEEAQFNPAPSHL
jgi:isocitrate lyase